MVHVGGVDDTGWRHFVVTGGVVNGEAAEIRVQDVWLAEQRLCVQVEFVEPMAAQRTQWRVARLELQIPDADLPHPLQGAELYVEGEPIEIAVDAADALGLVRINVKSTAFGLAPETVDSLEASRVLLVRGNETKFGPPEWKWYVELAPQGSQARPPSIHGIVNAHTGEIVELVVD
jgi:hypothetical protein